MTSYSSPLFRSCLLPINITEKTFLQLKRENEQIKREKFLLPIERSFMQEMADELGHSREMSDIWCPWKNYDPDMQFIEEVSSHTSIVKSLEKYKMVSLKDRTMKVLPSSPQTQQKISQLEADFSPKSLLSCQLPSPPARPDVMDGELFPPLESRMTEDMLSQGARRLLEQLDNPQQFLSRLPSLPLPVWSNTGVRQCRVVEKMGTAGGHFVMGKEVEVDRFGLGFKENEELCRSRLYRQELGVEGRERWEFLRVEMLDKMWLMDEGAKNSKEGRSEYIDLVDKCTGVLNSQELFGDNQDGDVGLEFLEHEFCKEIEVETDQIVPEVSENMECLVERVLGEESDLEPDKTIKVKQLNKIIIDDDTSDSTVMVSNLLREIVSSVLSLPSTQSVRSLTSTETEPSDNYSVSIPSQTCHVTLSFHVATNLSPTPPVYTKTNHSTLNHETDYGTLQPPVTSHQLPTSPLTCHLAPSPPLTCHLAPSPPLTCHLAPSPPLTCHHTPLSPLSCQHTPTPPLSCHHSPKPPLTPSRTCLLAPKPPLTSQCSPKLPAACYHNPTPPVTIHNLYLPTPCQLTFSQPVTTNPTSPVTSNSYHIPPLPKIRLLTPTPTVATCALSTKLVVTTSYPSQTSSKTSNASKPSSTPLKPSWPQVPNSPLHGTLSSDSEVSFMSSSAASDSSCPLLDIAHISLSAPSPVPSSVPAPPLPPHSGHHLTQTAFSSPSLLSEVSLGPGSHFIPPAPATSPQSTILDIPVQSPLDAGQVTTPQSLARTLLKVTLKTQSPQARPQVLLTVPGIPVSQFLLPCVEDWSAYMAQMVEEELLYRPRTAGCRQETCDSDMRDMLGPTGDTRLSPTCTIQPSRLSLLSKLKSVQRKLPPLDERPCHHTPTPVPHQSPPCHPSNRTFTDSSHISQSPGCDQAVTQPAQQSPPLESSHPTPPHCVLIQGQLADNEALLMELEHQHGLLVHDLSPSDQLPHLLTGPATGVFIFWPGVVMPSQSAESCYTASCDSFRQLWFVSVLSLDIYQECCQLSYWTSRTRAACKLLAAAVTGRQQLAQLLADIVHNQPRLGLTKQLRENISRHEKLLVSMFPCLNPYAVRVILTRTSLLQFLSLDQSSISSLFPWLPEAAAGYIAQVTASSFQLSQFVNSRQMDQVRGTMPMVSLMDRDVREMEVNRIMFGDGEQMGQSLGMGDVGQGYNNCQF